MNKKELRLFLDRKVNEYNQPSFIANDPVCIPHLFTKKQDIEISALFAALFAWGNRTTIINKGKELMQLMDNAPHEFCMQSGPEGLKKLLNFRHRTFNTTDLLYFVAFLQFHYSGHSSLEPAFTRGMKKKDHNMENGLNGFYHYFFSLQDAPTRTRKHIASPEKKATCKRLNMFLRWMVRRDDRGVDFGIWKTISPAQLVCPLDLHVARVARHFGLVTRKQTDWATAVELTENLLKMDPKDPVKYDLALFSLGVMGHY